MSLYQVSQALTESFINLGLGITIAHENVNTDPDNDVPFVTLTFMPTMAESLGKASVGDADQTNGIFQASFYVPSGTSTGAVMQLVDTVLQFYKHTATLIKDTQEVQIQNSGRNVGRNEEGWYVVDVSILFFAYIDRS